MKQIFLILFSALALSSCKTTECYVHVSTEKFIIEDTVELHSIHYHYQDMEGKNECAYVPSFTLPYIDTICVDIYELRKVKCKKCF